MIHSLFWTQSYGILSALVEIISYTEIFSDIMKNTIVIELRLFSFGNRRSMALLISFIIVALFMIFDDGGGEDVYKPPNFSVRFK